MKITVFCNNKMIRLLKPITHSKLVRWGTECTYTAIYDIAKLNGVTEQQCEDANAWWREISRLNIGLEHHPRIMRKQGLFNYILNQINCSSEKNIACAIGTISGYECKTPIELFNSL